MKLQRMGGEIWRGILSRVLGLISPYDNCPKIYVPFLGIISTPMNNNDETGTDHLSPNSGTLNLDFRSPARREHLAT